MESNLLYERRLYDPNDKISSCISELTERNNSEVYSFNGNELMVANIISILGAKEVANTKLGKVSKKLSPLVEYDHEEAVRRMVELRITTYPLRIEKQRLLVLDGLGLAESWNQKYNASDIMRAELPSVSIQDSASKARKIMLEKRIEHLLVTNGRKMGVNAIRLLLELYPVKSLTRGNLGGSTEQRLGFKILEVAEQINEVEPDYPVKELVEKLKKERNTAFYVSVWGEIQGIVTVNEVIRSMVRAKQPESKEYTIIGLPDEPFVSELVKIKMQKIVDNLKRSIDVKEVLCTIKKVGNTKAREVKLRVIHNRGEINLSVSGYELVDLFDELINKVRKKISEQRRVKTRETLRKSME